MSLISAARPPTRPGRFIHWPTIPTLLQPPVIVRLHVDPARREEKRFRAEFGDRYAAYRQRVPMFIRTPTGRRRAFPTSVCNEKISPPELMSNAAEATAGTERTVDKIMKPLIGVALATLAFVGTASAAPTSQMRTGPRLHAPHSAPALRDPETTGSLAGSLNRTRGLRDVQGRDFRSSTRGNAQFPERLPAQQNLGGTAGGPGF